MRQVVLRGLVAHKMRLAATFMAVALGVAFVGGVLTLTDTMNRTFDDLFATAYEGTDAVVRSDRTIEGEFEEKRGTIDAAVLDQVRDVDSVAEAEGQIEGFARIVDRDGDPVGGGAFSAPTMGGNWVENDDLNPLTVRSGRPPERAGEVMLDKATVDSTDYQVGDDVPIQTRGGLETFEMVGVAGFGTADSSGGASYVVFTTDDAQRYLGEAGRFGTVAAVAADGVDERELVSDIRGALGTVGADADIEVLTGTAIVEESQSDLRSELSFVTNFFLAFAVVALVVGSFVIYNSFSIVVAQRTREMALLRAVGASRKQVRRAVLLEAGAVGLVGSVAGFLLGLGIASLLTGLMDVDSGLAVLPTSVASAVLTGLVVTLVSALVPARRASKVPPVAAMRDVAIDTTGRSRIRFAIGALLVLAGVAGVVSGANTEEVSTVALGVGAAFLGLLFAGPGLARPVGAFVGWPLGRTRGVAGVLARENARRNPRRSASTAQALMIGVGIVAFFMVINASIRASIDKTLEDNFNGDLIVDSGTFGTIGIPPQVAGQISELDGVEAVAPMRFNQARVDDDTEDVIGTTSDIFPIVGQEVVDGSDRLGRGEVVVHKDIATDDRLAVGDTIRFDFLDVGPVELTVAGIYDGPQASEIGDYIVGVDELAQHVTDDTDVQVFVELADGASLPAVEREVQRITDGAIVGAEVQTIDEFKDTIAGQLDVFLTLVLGLLVLAIVIALLGIANTIALSVLERTRELGLLRAVGMSRRQLRSTIRWESVIIALFGTTLGLAVGVLGGWGMVSAFRDEGFEVFQVPVGVLITVAAVAAASGMAAAVIPAWRASRLDVLDAIHSE